LRFLTWFSQTRRARDHSLEIAAKGCGAEAFKSSHLRGVTQSTIFPNRLLARVAARRAQAGRKSAPATSQAVGARFF
jgi:hypothetical protein